jgi:hypothetical protein
MKPTDKPVTRESDKFMLRLPDGMRARIAEAARHNGRSMNTEIVDRLQQSFEPGHDLASMSWLDLVQRLQAEAKKHGATIRITVG